MTTATLAQPLSVEQATALADFARACKAATRAVSLYPGAHPAIASTLARVVSTATALNQQGGAHIVVHPGALLLGDRAANRPDPSIGELAALMHSKLIGAIRLNGGATVDDWRHLLLLLGSPLEDLLAQGGIAKAFAATGGGHFDIDEIDYASVLKERTSAGPADWDQVLAHCLKGEAVPLDDGVIDMLLSTLENDSRFGDLLNRLHDRAETDGKSTSSRLAALFQLLKAALAAAEARGVGGRDQALDTVAKASSNLTPEMLLGLLAQRESPDAEAAGLAKDVLSRMSDETVASFVAKSVSAERGASARLAQAFEALVPDQEKRAPLLELAHDEAKAGELGQDPRFEQMWEGATKVMLATYSDEGFVSADYARELSAARTQAIEVERTSDDPPERIAAWLRSVNEGAIREADLLVTLDLLRIESDGDLWESMAEIAARDVERRAADGDFGGAQQLVEAIVGETAGARPALHLPAQLTLLQLAGGPLTRHIAGRLRKASEAEVAVLTGLCHAIGPNVVRPLAETLSNEDNAHAISRIKDVLLSFGSAGRQAVEPLKSSSNPAVRRTAIDLLRAFGGNEALRELTAMLSDADPQVQQDSIRAIVRIGTKESYAVIERACASNPATRTTVVRELVSLRDPKTIPPLCHVLMTTEPKGPVVAEHEAIIEALSSLRAHPDSTTALRTALYRGTWWAPVRTARLRHAAAKGLRRLGSDDAWEALQEAARRGNRNVRKIAGAELALGPRQGARA